MTEKPKQDQQPQMPKCPWCGISPIPFGFLPGTARLSPELSYFVLQVFCSSCLKLIPVLAGPQQQPDIPRIVPPA